MIFWPREPRERKEGALKPRPFTPRLRQRSANSNKAQRSPDGERGTSAASLNKGPCGPVAILA